MYPQGLNDMFLAPHSGDLFMEQFNNASKTDQLGHQKTLQDMDFARQKQPGLLEEMALKNQTTQAQLPGHRATSGMLEDKADISRSTIDLQKKAAMSALWKQMSDDDLKQADNALEQALNNPDPAVRQKASVVLQSRKEFQLQRMKDAADQKKVETQGKTARDVANIGAAASRYGADKRAEAGGDGDGPDGKMNYERAAVYYQMIAAKLPDGHPDKKRAEEQADMYAKLHQQAQIMRAAAGQAGDPDIQAVTRGQVPTMPAPVPGGMPRPQPQAPTQHKQSGAVTGPQITPAQEDWISRAMKANPGMGREQVIQIGKQRGKL